MNTIILLFVYWIVIGSVVTFAAWIADDFNYPRLYQRPIELVISVIIWPLVMYWIIIGTIRFLFQQQGNHVENDTTDE